MNNYKLPELTQTQENAFINFISKRLGIVINDYQRHDLHKSIIRSCQKLNCPPDNYLTLLTNCPDDSPLIEDLITSITIGETYFFRDAHQMKLLREIVFPSIIKSKREQNDLTLRIWSAGCSTGEEIYTLAIMVFEMLPDLSKWNLHFLATDINTASLRKAMDAVYSEWSMRAISNEHKTRYFNTTNNKYHLLDQIKNLVTFSWLNLQSDAFPSLLNNTNAMDLILCRNVLIYFDANHIENLMHKLSACLVQGGFILLGASDPVNIKKTNLASYPHEAALLRHAPEKSDKPIPPITITEFKTILPQTNCRPVKQLLKVTKVQDTDDKEFQDKIVLLLENTQWQEALDLIQIRQEKHKPSVAILNAKALALANLGHLDQAADVYQQSLVLEPLSAVTHFMHAIVLIEQNHLNQAEISLRKSLYLNHEFAAGHYQLGLLQIRNHQKKDGIKSLNNALTITGAKNSSSKVEGVGSLDNGQFAEILKREIELYSDADLNGVNHE